MMTMRNIYSWIRITGYGCGALAALLILWGRHSAGDYGGRMVGLGFGLLVTMFILFCCSYVVFALIRR